MKLPYFLASERVVGSQHATLPDTINRAVRSLLQLSGFGNPDVDFPGLNARRNPIGDGAPVDGITDAKLAVSTALANATGAGIEMFPGSYLLSSDLTILAATMFHNGAMFKPSGSRLTLKGPINAGPYQIFDMSAGGKVQGAKGVSVVVLPEWFGAKGDVKWDGDPVLGIAGQCSITAGSVNPTAPVALWDPVADAPQVVNGVTVKKKFVMYGAGPTLNNFKQPLVADINAVAGDGKSVTLSVAASNAVTSGAYTGGSNEGSIAGMISRVAWGTDDTVAIQAAVDFLAVWDGVSKSNIGGKVQFSAKHYFTLGIKMFEAQTTSILVNAYNRIWLAGCGEGTTEIEVFDPVNGAAVVQGAVVSATTDSPSNTPGADWLRGFKCSDMTLRQTQHNTNPTNILTLGAAYDPHIYNLHCFGWSYEGFALGGHGRRGHVHDNVLNCAGRGGPANPPSTSGFNIFAAEAIVENNKTFGCGQGMELSSHRGLVQKNVFDGIGVPAFVNPVYGINIGSGVDGVWSLQVLDNTFRNYPVAMSVSNVSGTLNRLTISGNTITDGCITFTSGLEANSVAGIDIETDSIVHGDSAIVRNTFIYTKFPANSTITIGPAGGTITNACLEQLLIKNNTVVTPGMFCSGGTRNGLLANVQSDCPGGGQAFSVTFLVANNYGPKRWVPGTFYDVGFYVVPRKTNGFMYKATVFGTSGAATAEPVWPTAFGATVTDNGITWTCFGKEPQIVLEGNTVSGASQQNADANAITASFRFDFGTTRRESIAFISHSQSYAWGMWNGSSSEGFDGFPGELIPAGEIYSDRRRYSDTLPTKGRYPLGTKIFKQTASTVATGTRGGEAGAAWAATHAYAYGARVVPTVDNGHVYECIVAGTSAGTDPGASWPLVAGGTLVDGTVTWKEIGTAVLFSAYA